MRPVDEKIFNDNNIVHLPYSDLYIISHADAIVDDAIFLLIDIPECQDHRRSSSAG
ncbi:hypothetical protein PF003_g24499 [Phytophthora fragariae]|nr:hypothetical protein PF003_g24499 [Phytophthora fragariae]